MSALDSTNIPRLPPPVRGHSRSQTADIPSLNRSSTYLPFWTSSRSSSPQRSTPLTLSNVGSTVSLPEPRPDKVKRLTSWFEGSSQPVNIGLVASQDTEQEEDCDPARSVMSSPALSTSRFSFFKKQPSIQQSPSGDGLENLNVQDALFPQGPVDEFSPAAFKNLQQNAEGTLKLMQQTLRETLAALQKAKAHKESLSDDLEGEQTRNEHLKAQLLDMADKAVDQEKVIEVLQAENEKLRINEANLRSIRLINDNTTVLEETRKSVHSRSRRKRSSGASLDSTDTDLSSVSSVFSDADDAASEATSVGCSTPDLTISPPELKHARLITPNIRTTEHLRSLTTDIMLAVPDCQKCRSPTSNEAMDMLNVIMAENAGLKQYIQQMESVRDDIEDLCTWKPIEMLDINDKCTNMIGGEAGLRMLDNDAVQERLRDGCIV